MPYGYDKTRSERRCKDCNKLLYVFETGKYCIECSRKQAKTTLWKANPDYKYIERKRKHGGEVPSNWERVKCYGLKNIDV